MRRKSCQEWDNKSPNKPMRKCLIGKQCSDSCTDYSRRIKWAQWKLPLSLCHFVRYRYKDGKRYLVCAKGFDILERHNQDCPCFKRRKG